MGQQRTLAGWPSNDAYAPKEAVRVGMIEPPESDPEQARAKTTAYRRRWR
jgi:hypothetical protein